MATKPLSVSDAKAKVLHLLAAGETVVAAAKAVGRSEKAYANWRAADKEFAAAADAARQKAAKVKESGRDPENYSLSFAEWRLKFLGRETYPHQQLWIDVLEG